VRVCACVCVDGYSEYYATLQCLHNSLMVVDCSADDTHLYVIASRVGHLRTFMRQTCTTTTTTTAAAAVDHRPGDVIADHVTPPPVTTTKDNDDDDDDNDDVRDSSSNCFQTTTAAGVGLLARSQPLHRSSAGGASTSWSTCLATSPLVSAAAVAVVVVGVVAALRHGPP